MVDNFLSKIKRENAVENIINAKNVENMDFF